MSLIAFLFIVGLYFLPTIIAAARHKQNTIAIGALNLFLGWSFIGWIVALIWALSADPQMYQHVVNVSQNVGMPPYYPQQGMPQPPQYAPPGMAPPHSGYPVPEAAPYPAAAQPHQVPQQYEPPAPS